MPCAFSKTIEKLFSDLPHVSREHMVQPTAQQSTVDARRATGSLDRDLSFFNFRLQYFHCKSSQKMKARSLTAQLASDGDAAKISPRRCEVTAHDSILLAVRPKICVSRTSKALGIAPQAKAQFQPKM